MISDKMMLRIQNPETDKDYQQYQKMTAPHFFDHSGREIIAGQIVAYGSGKGKFRYALVHAVGWTNSEKWEGHAPRPADCPEHIRRWLVPCIQLHPIDEQLEFKAPYPRFQEKRVSVTNSDRLLIIHLDQLPSAVRELVFPVQQEIFLGRKPKMLSRPRGPRKKPTDPKMKKWAENIAVDGAV